MNLEDFLKPLKDNMDSDEEVREKIKMLNYAIRRLTENIETEEDFNRYRSTIREALENASKDVFTHEVEKKIGGVPEPMLPMHNHQLETMTKVMGALMFHQARSIVQISMLDAERFYDLEPGKGYFAYMFAWLPYNSKDVEYVFDILIGDNEEEVDKVRDEVAYLLETSPSHDAADEEKLGYFMDDMEKSLEIISKASPPPQTPQE
jgi:hypothetical protein